MTKNELISSIAHKAGNTKSDTEKMLNALVETITEEMKAGNKVQLVGFGTFEPHTRAERTGRNPVTKETITIKAQRSVKFKISKTLKDILN